MSCEKSSMPVFVIGLSILAMFGCGGTTDEPGPSTPDDLMLKEKLIGEWDVVSVNDIEPSRFLTILMVEASNDDNPGVAEEVVPAAPEGEFVIIEDEVQEVYHVKADVHDFLYSFYEDDLWTLSVQFDILPNDEAVPVEVGDASDPGGAQADRIDPDKPAAPAANGTNDVLGSVVGTWTGTYQVESDMLTLTIETEGVKVTPTNEVFEEIADTTEADTQAELINKFRMRLINPFRKTFIQINDIGKLTLKVPGSARGEMRLENRDSVLPKGVQE